MYQLKWIVLYNCFASTLGLNNLFLKKDVYRSSIQEQNRTRSLANLLKHVINEYFEDCALGVIYDSNYEIIHPVDFHQYFADLKLTIMQDSVDFSTSEKPRTKQSEKCINYIVFLYNIQAIKRVLSQDNESKIIIVSSETPWEVEDFLKSQLSRVYKNLLVVTHSVSRKNGVRINIM